MIKPKKLSELVAYFLQVFPPSHNFIYSLLPRMAFMLPHDKSYKIIPYLATKENGLILDAGANNGISSVYFRHVMPKWNILAIEPNPIHKKDLNRLKKNNNLFDFIPIALSNKNGTMTLYTQTWLGFPLHTAASLKTENFNYSESFPSFLRNHLKIKNDLIKVTTIDDLNIAPDIIKIDCEGMDLHVLNGSKRTILESRPYSLFENNEADYDDIIKLSHLLGMEVYFYDHNKNDLSLYKKGITTNSNDHRNLVMIPSEKLDYIKSKINVGKN